MIKKVKPLVKNKTALLCISLILFVLNVFLIDYQYWKDWRIILVLVTMTLWILVTIQYRRVVRSENIPITKKQNSLLLVIFVLFIANLLMFDYLSWDIWWVPIAHVSVIVSFIWLIIIFFRKLHSSK
jgi:cell division protein FtsW (lipid II flippase)